MIEVDLTPVEEELFFTASDAQALFVVIHGLNLLPEDETRMANAIAERGVSLYELLGLVWNAAVHAVTKNTTAVMMRGLPCNIRPDCEEWLGHSGPCDPEEVPF